MNDHDEEPPQDEPEHYATEDELREESEHLPLGGADLDDTTRGHG